MREQRIKDRIRELILMYNKRYNQNILNEINRLDNILIDIIKGE